MYTSIWEGRIKDSVHFSLKTFCFVLLLGLKFNSFPRSLLLFPIADHCGSRVHQLQLGRPQSTVKTHNGPPNWPTQRLLIPDLNSEPGPNCVCVCFCICICVFMCVCVHCSFQLCHKFLFGCCYCVKLDGGVVAAAAAPLSLCCTYP